MKKKKIIITITTVVLVLAVVALSVYAWCANNPQYRISIGKPTNKTDFYIEHGVFGYYETLGVSATEKRMNEYIEINETLLDAFCEYREKYEAPTHLELEFTEAEDGGTIARYHGTVTEDGVTSDFDYQWEFDFKYVSPEE